MIDHISIGVADLGRARAFYDAVLPTIGYGRRSDDDHSAGYGNERTVFWINRTDQPRGASPGGHIALTSPSRDAVGAFHKAAVTAGAKDDGAPGLRPQYHANYYAAFVIDPDGHRIEAVCHRPY